MPVLKPVSSTGDDGSVIGAENVLPSCKCAVPHAVTAPRSRASGAARRRGDKELIKELSSQNGRLVSQNSVLVDVVGVQTVKIAVLETAKGKLDDYTHTLAAQLSDTIMRAAAAEQALRILQELHATEVQATTEREQRTASLEQRSVKLEADISSAASLIEARDRELEDLKAQLVVMRASTSQVRVDADLMTQLDATVDRLSVHVRSPSPVPARFVSSAATPAAATPLRRSERSVKPPSSSHSLPLVVPAWSGAAKPAAAAPPRSERSAEPPLSSHPRPPGVSAGSGAAKPAAAAPPRSERSAEPPAAAAGAVGPTPKSPPPPVHRTYIQLPVPMQSRVPRQ